MDFNAYKIGSIEFITHDTFIIQIERRGSVFEYISGDYCYLKNPSSSFPQDERPFSIASTPTNTSYIEFCIKIYGEWTRQLSVVKPGDTILLSNPQHDTVLLTDPYIVFLVGGVGIAPVISMLRYIVEVGMKTEVVLLYGNKTEKDIIYREELATIAANHSQIHITHILSEEPEGTEWKGKRGFITEEVVLREINTSHKPHYYLFGNALFLEKARNVIRVLENKDS